MIRKVPYSVPEGYLENLGSSISSSLRPRQTPFLWKAAPVAIAFAALALVAFLWLGGKPRGTGYDEQDEIIEYLIETGTTLAQIENYNENF